MKKHNLAFIDVEMTGLNPVKHEIIEIGAVITTPGLEVVEEFDIKIKPENLENADPVSLKVSNYNKDAWEKAVFLPEAIKILLEKVKDCIMVGHNIAFAGLSYFQLHPKQIFDYLNLKSALCRYPPKDYLKKF